MPHELDQFVDLAPARAAWDAMKAAAAAQATQLVNAANDNARDAAARADAAQTAERALRGEMERLRATPPLPPPPGAVVLTGAHPSGRADSTAAIQSAMRSPRRLYLPPGTYRVSDTLFWKNAAGVWRAYLWMCGAGPLWTRLVLAADSPGFGDPAKPKPILVTGNNPWEKMAEEHKITGGGHSGFANFITDLSIDCGNNGGAVGIDASAMNNCAAVENVDIKGGCIGVDLSRKFPGPMVLWHVTATGGEIGLRVGKEALHYGITATQCLFRGRQADILNHGILSVEAVEGAVSGPGRVYRGDQ